MSHSNIRIYYSTNEQFYLTEDKNAIIDDFDQYLDQFQYIEINDFMYLKIRLDLEIKVQLDQRFSHLQAYPPLHYVRITEDDLVYYYFIRDYEWISESGVRLALHMDVLNTVHLGSDYDFGGENVVTRQHFDRFNRDNSGHFYRDINIYPEGITPVLFKTDEKILYDNALSKEYRDESFNLVFMNQDDSSSTTKNPVIMLLVGDQRFYYETDQDESTWPSTVQGLNGYYIKTEVLDNIVNDLVEYETNTYGSAPNSISFHIFLRGSSTSSSLGTSSYPNPKDIDYTFTEIPVAYYVDSNTSKTESRTTSILPSSVDELNGCARLDYEIKIYPSGSPSAGYLIGINYNNTSSSGYSNERTTTAIGFFIGSGSSSGTVKKKLNLGIYTNYYYGIYYTGLSEQSYLASINEIDRTDSRIIKIIKLPYDPIDLLIDSSGRITIPDNWQIDSITFSPTGKAADEYSINALKAESSIESLNRKINFEDENEETVSSPSSLIELTDDDYSDFYKATRNNYSLEDNWDLAMKMESKLLQSAFYYQKLVYDSFSLTIQPECIVFESDTKSLSLQYICSTAANCHILNILNHPLQYQTEDYSGIFTINRNNDIPLYSNAYLDYLRTGYNYDVKNKNLQIVQNSLSAAGSLASIGTLTNPASIVSNTVKGVSNTVMSAIQSENNLQKTLTEKQYSTASINGSDDLDLLIGYTNNNKYKIITYEVAPYMKKVLTKLFQLTGYACNLYGSPNMTSRRNFNYASCQPDIEYHRQIPTEIMEEIENKWSGGVFEIHHAENIWDLTFDTLNGEISLL